MGPDALILAYPAGGGRDRGHGGARAGGAAAPAAAPRRPRSRGRAPLPWRAGSPARTLAGRRARAGLQAALPFARPQARTGTARPLLLAGPPGAGKTLTVARLATRHGDGAAQKPLVVTADGKRAGAAEQLAAFTRLLGLSLMVASHPVTLAPSAGPPGRRRAGADRRAGDRPVRPGAAGRPRRRWRRPRGPRSCSCCRPGWTPGRAPISRPASPRPARAGWSRPAWISPAASATCSPPPLPAAWPSPRRASARAPPTA